MAGTALTEAEFKDLLRIGKQGELGNDHLYGTSAISESGIPWTGTGVHRL